MNKAWPLYIAHLSLLLHCVSVAAIFDWSCEEKQTEKLQFSA